MFKRLFALVLASVIMLTTLCACAQRGENTPANGTPEVTTADTKETESEITTTEATTTEATTTPEQTTETPATTTEATTTTVATTTEATTTTTEATTTVATTTTEATTTVATTTTEATTTAAPKPVELGVLGYNLKEKISTDKSLAKGKVSSLVINEICPSNKNALDDKDGEAKDWIEIYNPTKEIINLEGVGLSDDSSDPFKWTFPSVNIQPGSYIIVFASDKNIKTPELHTNYKISGGNEQIVLTAADGKTIDTFIISTTSEDQTYGRYPDGSDDFKLMSATPGKSNDKAKTVTNVGTLKPIFSKESGFYEQQFSLKITAEPGCTIYYTTDGSIPTTKSKKYSESITIKDRSSEKAIYTYKKNLTVTNDVQYPNKEFEKATIIRAIAVDKNGKVSDITTATYFVSKSIAQKYSKVDLISVVIDPNDLYDHKKGIYVNGKVFEDWRKEHPTAALDGNSQANFNQRGREWERDAHIDYFSSTKLEFSNDVGVRIHGGWSRNNAQKSLRFYFREEYGEKKLDYTLFEDNYAEDNGKLIKSYRRFLIRNGGNDTYFLTFKDPWTQSLFKDFHFGTQATNLVICFLDGEYWGLYTACESIDKHYIEDHYGVPDEDVIMVKNGGLDEGEEGEYELWREARRFIRDNDMTNEKNYAKACELVDMDSFTEYLAAEVYICNQDWLWNNASWWRSRSTNKAESEYQDGKWRFAMFDVEFSMDLYGDGRNAYDDILDELLNGDGYFGPLFKSLIKNKDFKTKFILACENVMNIAFNVDLATKRLNEYYNEYSPYIDQHMDRFVPWQSLGGVADHVKHWSDWVSNRSNTFLGIVKTDLEMRNATENKVTININDSSMGIVKVNGYRIPFKNKSWSGKYLSGYKITIKAVPAKGYEFVGWTGGYEGDSASITVNPSSALKLTANFKKK